MTVCLFTCEDKFWLNTRVCATVLLQKVEYPSLCKSASAKILLCNGLDHSFDHWLIECALTKGNKEALHPFPVCWMALALIFYRGKAHEIEYLLNQWSCLEALHPAFAHCTSLEFSLVKGYLEALHPNPFVWLVCESVCDLVHSLYCSLVAVIESNDWSEQDFQRLSSDW